MAAAASRQYLALFQIGAKLQASFGGVMKQAASHLKTLQGAAVKVMGSLWRFGKRVLALGGILGGFAAAKIFKSIFEGAAEEAAAAEQRTLKLTAGLMRNKAIAKGGIENAKQQAKLLQQHNLELGKNSVISEDMRDAASAQLSTFGLSTKRIANMQQGMADVLAMSRGVNATSEDAVGLANAIGIAIETKQTRGLRKFNLVMDEGYQKQWKAAKTAEQRYNVLQKFMGEYAGSEERLNKTGAARVKLLENEITRWRRRIGEATVDVRGRMADAWRSALDQIEPFAMQAVKSWSKAMTWVADETEKFFKVLGGPKGKKALDDLQTQAEKTFKQVSDSLGKMLGIKKDMSVGEWVAEKAIQGIEKLTDALKWFGDNADWLVPKITEISKWIGLIGAGLILSSLVTNPFVWVPAATAAVWALYESWETTGPAIKKWAEQNKGSLAGEFAGLAAQRIDTDIEDIEKFKQLWEDIKEGWEDLKTGFGILGEVMIEGIQKVGSAISKWITSGIDKAKKAWEDLKNAFAGWSPSGIAEKITSAGSSAIEWVKQKAGYGPQAAQQKQYGGIIRSATNAIVGEAGPEAIIPLSGGRRAAGLLNYASQAMGFGRINAGPTTMTFAPVITINGNASETEQRAMDSRLRDLATDFINQFQAAQAQERRLSFESGYA